MTSRIARAAAACSLVLLLSACNMTVQITTHLNGKGGGTLGLRMALDKEVRDGLEGSGGGQGINALEGLFNRLRDAQWNVNPVFERVLRSKDGEPHFTELGYQLQVRYPIRGNDFAIGAQAFGDLGKWNDWEPRDEQSHAIGPAIFGRVKLGGREQIKYNAAWLIGSNAAPRNTFRLQAEYEF